MPREGKLTIVRRLKDHLRTAQPWSCTFVHEIPPEVREAVEARLKEAFERWWASWIQPDLELLEEKLAPSKKRASR